MCILWRNQGKPFLGLSIARLGDHVWSEERNTVGRLICSIQRVQWQITGGMDISGSQEHYPGMVPTKYDKEEGKRESQEEDSEEGERQQRGTFCLEWKFACSDGKRCGSPKVQGEGCFFLALIRWCKDLQKWVTKIGNTDHCRGSLLSLASCCFRLDTVSMSSRGTEDTQIYCFRLE